jgi:hypothetical protein
VMSEQRSENQRNATDGRAGISGSCRQMQFVK